MTNNHDQAETAFLGAILSAQEAPGRCLDVEPSDFLTSELAEIFDCICEVVNDDLPPDVFEVCRVLKSRGRPGLTGLVAELAWAGVATNVEIWAERVIEASRTRATKHALQEALSRSEEAGDRESVMAGVMDAISKIPDERKRARTRSLKDLGGDLLREIETAHKSGGLRGASTGLRSLDAMLGGLRDGELTIIAARPSMGKSALTGNMLVGMAKHDPSKRYLFASLEMPSVSVLSRMVAAEGRVDFGRLTLGNIKSADWPKITQGASVVQGLPVHICDSPSMTVADIRQEARRLGNVGGVFVDYLQLAKPIRKGNSEHEELNELTRSLKTLAKALGCPVVALSQLNRQVEQRSPPIPRLSDLRGSGGIEEHADVALMLYRPEYYSPEDRPGEADIIVAKARNGRTGALTVQWLGKFQLFQDFEKKAGF